jgi:hypothetical protein
MLRPEGMRDKAEDVSKQATSRSGPGGSSLSFCHLLQYVITTSVLLKASRSRVA